MNAIERRGGTVLKLIGDMVLAIFQPNGKDIEATRHAGEKTPLGYGIALHVGDVLYANVGGQSRLDFTVIGPAVTHMVLMFYRSESSGLPSKARLRRFSTLMPHLQPTRRLEL